MSRDEPHNCGVQYSDEWHMLNAVGDYTFDVDYDEGNWYPGRHHQEQGGSPMTKIICICGSTRFRAEMAAANRDLTLAGIIVLAPGVFAHDGDVITDAQKVALDRLHRDKIGLAHEVLVVNPNGYVGESTRREIAYARQTGKPVSFTHPSEGERP